MRNPSLARVILAITFFGLPFIYAQLTISVPPCISKCIDQSTDDSCAVTDLKCVCRESNGRFLPDVVLCMHGACENTLDVNVLLTPLSLACQLLGTPISPSALANAQIEASQIAHMTTVTITQTGNIAPTPVTASSGRVVVTVTEPAVAPTITQVVPGSTVYTGLVPAVVIGTNSAGSAYTTTATVPGAISTITMTNSAGSTVTVVSTLTQAGGPAAGAIVLQTLTTTNSAGSTYTTIQNSTQAKSSANGGGAFNPVSGSTSGSISGSSSPAPQSVTGSQSPTKLTTNPNAANTDSSPFGVQGSADRKRAGSLLGLAVMLIISFL